MTRRCLLRRPALAGLLALGFPFLAAAEPLHGIPFSGVTFSDTFWAPRITRAASSTSRRAKSKFLSVGRQRKSRSSALYFGSEQVETGVLNTTDNQLCLSRAASIGPLGYISA